MYESNKAVLSMIIDGFVFNREDRNKKDIFIELINYEELKKNIFKIVNQLEIEDTIIRFVFPMALFM